MRFAWIAILVVDLAGERSRGHGPEQPGPGSAAEGRDLLEAVQRRLSPEEQQIAEQWALKSAIKKFQSALTDREREAARKEVMDALAALERARREAGLPPK